MSGFPVMYVSREGSSVSKGGVPSLEALIVDGRRRACTREKLVVPVCQWPMEDGFLIRISPGVVHGARAFTAAIY